MNNYVVCRAFISMQNLEFKSLQKQYDVWSKDQIYMFLIVVQTTEPPSFSDTFYSDTPAKVTVYHLQTGLPQTRMTA